MFFRNAGLLLFCFLSVPNKPPLLLQISWDFSLSIKRKSFHKLIYNLDHCCIIPAADKEQENGDSLMWKCQNSHENVKIFYEPDGCFSPRRTLQARTWDTFPETNDLSDTVWTRVLRLPENKPRVVFKYCVTQCCWPAADCFTSHSPLKERTNGSLRAWHTWR